MLEVEQWMRLGEVLLVAFEMRRNCGVHVISSALYLVYMRAELTQPTLNKNLFSWLNHCYSLVNDVINTSRVVGDATSSSILQK